MSETETRAVRDVHDALAWRGRAESAEAENRRLRGVVEAVQALAVDAKVAISRGCLCSGNDCTGKCGAGKPLGWTLDPEQVLAVLAPVSSSGEAGRVRVDLHGARVHGRFSMPGRLGPVTIANGWFEGCSDCTHFPSGEAESGEGLNAVHAFGPDGLCPACGPFPSPAPVSSGGQADGEGEGLVEVVADKVHEAWMAAKREQGVSSRPSEWGEEQMVPYAALSERAKDLDRATVTAVLDALSAAGFAARPVLSREALRERLYGHWPETHSQTRMGCECGWSEGPDSDPRLPTTQYRDHLADVLTAGGEQE